MFADLKLEKAVMVEVHSYMPQANSEYGTFSFHILWLQEMLKYEDLLLCIRLNEEWTEHLLKFARF